VKNTPDHTELEAWEAFFFLVVVFIYGFVVGILFCKFS
jgi:hypothetical protein